MGGGFGYRNWNATLPPSGDEWPEADEFNSLSDQAYAEQLHPLRQAGPLLPGQVALISVVRNEALRLPLFFDHYKKLGVTRFMMIDNASEDRTPDLLLAEPLADIYHTRASFSDACHGTYWQNGLARAHCIGHWIVVADADELLVFDGMGPRTLVDLGAFLDRHSLDRLFAPMIDVYPPDVIGETGHTVADNFRSNSWFDPSGYALEPCPAGWLMRGGPRNRLFHEKLLGNADFASKYPFFRMTPERLVYHPHFIWPRDRQPARPLGALLHLKFMDDFAERSLRNELEGEHYANAEKYRIINRALAEKGRHTAFHPKSVKYTAPEDLIRHQLLLPLDWEKTKPEGLPHRRSLGDIEYRIWPGTGNSLTISESECEEFRDIALRAFETQVSVVRCRGRLEPGEIGLISVLRNEAARLPLFLDHYKRLGVSRFFLIDNNSDDETRELLLAEPLADIFHAHASFREGQAGLYWAQAVASRYGEGNWLMRPDGDELFVYDGMEEHGLSALAAWLDRHHLDRIFAPMVDLYPSSALERTSRSVEEVVADDGWFDNDGYELERWPQGWYLTGGPRDRVFNRDARTPTWKYPFFRMASDTVIYNHHWLWPHDEVTRGALGALLHLKFMNDFIERSARYEREGQHWQRSRAYRSINERMRELQETTLFYEGSKRYRGPRSLVRHGMLMPIDWDA